MIPTTDISRASVHIGQHVHKGGVWLTVLDVIDEDQRVHLVIGKHFSKQEMEESKNPRVWKPFSWMEDAWRGS